VPPGTWHSVDYGQVIATIFTDDTSSVRALLALVPEVAAGRLADGSVVVAPAAPDVLVAPDALLDAACLPVTVMRWPTCAARSPPFNIQVAAGPADADALAVGPPAAPAPDELGVEVAPLPLEADALACWTFVNVKPPSAPFAKQPVRLVSPGAAAVVCDDGVAG
jgi:hypothetical protein